jgi:hypothetical protein
VAIHRLLQNSAFGPEEIDRMVKAYEASVRVLRGADRSDASAEAVAKKIIEVAQTGERDPVKLSRRALKDLGLSPSH